MWRLFCIAEWVFLAAVAWCQRSKGSTPGCVATAGLLCVALLFGFSGRGSCNVRSHLCDHTCTHTPTACAVVITVVWACRLPRHQLAGSQSRVYCTRVRGSSADWMVTMTAVLQVTRQHALQQLQRMNGAMYAHAMVQYGVPCTNCIETKRMLARSHLF